MRITTEGRFGLWAAMVGLAGAGAIMIWPTHTEIGWSLIGAAVVGGLALTAHHIQERMAELRELGHRQQMFALLGMITCAIGFFGFAAAYYWPLETDVRPTSPAEQKLFSLTSAPNSTSALASLAGLGWTVKSTPEAIQFELASVPLPPMKESAGYFVQLDKPFSLQLQTVQSLQGLHYLADVSGCTKMQISAGEFTDISELRGFSHLLSLSISQVPLSRTGVVDASALASLTQLLELQLNLTRIRNIEFLSSLVHLEKLGIGNTLAVDLTPVAKLASLKELDIRETRITDLTPLASNLALSSLELGGRQVPGLVNLIHLEHLKTLRLIEQQEFDLAPVSLLSHLENLTILAPATKIDISSLRRLTGLRNFTLLGIGFSAPTQVTDIKAVGKMTEMQVLALSQLVVSDLSFVSGLRKLDEISIHQLPIASIEPLRGLKALKKVTLVQTSVADISPLLDLPELTELTIGRTPARSDVLAELERRGVKVTRF